MGLLVGLTGGIGSGKSEVGKFFADLGAFLIDADLLAREATVPKSEGVRRIAARWPHVLDTAGALDRKALGNIVFADPRELAALNAIVHPLVRTLMHAHRAQAAPGQLVIYEAALLFEAGVYRDMDLSVLVVAPLEERIERLLKRNGWEREHVVHRISSQIPPADAEKLAAHVLRNDGSLQDLQRNVQALYERLVKIT